MICPLCKEDTMFGYASAFEQWFECQTCGRISTDLVFPCTCKWCGERILAETSAQNCLKQRVDYTGEPYHHACWLESRERKPSWTEIGGLTEENTRLKKVCGERTAECKSLRKRNKRLSKQRNKLKEEQKEYERISAKLMSIILGYQETDEIQKIEKLEKENIKLKEATIWKQLWIDYLERHSE